MLLSKNKLQHIQLSDTTGTSNRTGLYVRMTLQQTLKMGLVHKGKRVPYMYN